MIQLNVLAPELVWDTAIQQRKVELEQLTDLDTLLMIGKSMKGTICHAIHWYAEANNICIYMTDYDKNKELSYDMYWDGNNLLV